MKSLRVWRASAAGLLCWAAFGTACHTSGSGGGSQGPVAAVSSAMASVGAFALVSRRAGLRVAGTVPCPGGGSIGFTEGSNFTITPVSASTSTYKGTVVANLSGCVMSGYTMAGSWTESLNLTEGFSADHSQFTVTGFIAVPNGNISLSGSACPINLTDTLTLAVASNTFSPTTVSGSVAYNGSVCGSSNSGSCSLLDSSCQ